MIGGGPALEDFVRVQRRLVHGIRSASPQALGYRANPDGWPVWAIASHLTGTRIYWLCMVCGEPGVEKAHFVDAASLESWEDHLDRPRTAAEVVDALEISWGIVEDTLERWTPEMLEVEIQVPRSGRSYSRRSILTRMVQHDAFHCGEISTLLAVNAGGSMDPWEPI